MDEPTKLEVVIDGRVYTIQGSESEEYIQQLARYMDKKISECKRLKPMTNTSFDSSTLFLLINIADDLFKQKALSEQAAEALNEKDEMLNKYMDELGKMTEENLLLKDKLSDTMLKYNNTKRELYEYIETFDTTTKTRIQKPYVVSKEKR